MRAKALVESEKLAEAEPLAEQLARDYPRDAENWMLLGRIKWGLKSTPKPPSPMSWRRDIDFLYSETKRVNPDYRNVPFPAEVTRRYEELKKNISKLSDEEIFVGMSRMLAPLHQGHVALWSPSFNRHLPVRLYEPEHSVGPPPGNEPGSAGATHRQGLFRGAGSRDGSHLPDDRRQQEEAGRMKRVP